MYKWFVWVVFMKAKKYYLEFIRAACMLLVIFNHTGTKGFMLYTVSTNSFMYPIYMFISIACKVAVPLYWMISGALLLPKDESIKTVYKHRVLRMIIVLLFFSFITYLWQYLIGSVDKISFGYFFKNLYSGNFATAYWFIYSYIGMMMILPLLRKLVKSMKKEHFIYLFLLIFATRGILPIIQYIVSNGKFYINSNIIVNIFNVNILYFISGYYFDNFIKPEELNKKSLWKWITAGVISILITGLITQYKINVTGIMDVESVQEFYNCLICIPTFAIFYAFRYIFTANKISNYIEKIIEIFGSAAFGIMLIEHILRHYLIIVYNKLFPIIKSLPACLVYVLCVYLVGVIIIYMLKKIPVIKKLI